MTQPTFSLAAKWELEEKFEKLWYLATMTAKWEIINNSKSVEFTENSEKIEFGKETLEVGGNHAKLTVEPKFLWKWENCHVSRARGLFPKQKMAEPNDFAGPFQF